MKAIWEIFSSLIISFGESRRISLAIPVYNRPELIQVALAYPIHDRRIDEIIIHDDGSDSKNYHEMVAGIEETQCKKIRIYRDEYNRGPFTAKYNAVKQCRNDWVILLDSDNSISIRYVNCLYKLNCWNEKIIYCPGYARPQFNFREFNDELIDLQRARELLLRESHNPRFVATLLNTGNYFLNKENFLKSLEGYVKYRIPAGDVLIANYLWMQTGGRLKIISKLTYQHRVHEDSNFIKKGVASQAKIKCIRQAIANGETINLSDFYDEHGPMKHISESGSSSLKTLEQRNDENKNESK